MATQINYQRHTPNDCIICTTRPMLYLSQINIYQATFHCYHSNPPSKPHFQPSKLLKMVTFACSVILLYGVINDLRQTYGKFVSRHALIYIEIIYNVEAIICNCIFWAKNDIRLLESHGLITLMKNKFQFGVSVILPGPLAKKLHDVLFYFIIFFLIEEVIMSCVALILEQVNTEFLVRMIAIEVFILSNAALGFYCMQCLLMYEIMFERCFQEIESFLRDAFASRETKNPQIVIDKLQKLQRLYMSLRRNYQLNEEFLQPGVLLLYSVDICLLIIGYGYWILMFFEGEVVLLKFDVFLIMKSAAFVVAFYFLCYQVQKVSSTVCWFREFSRLWMVCCRLTTFFRFCFDVG